nr:unnamed protein product [Spirometra erinaceieuropaei]
MHAYRDERPGTCIAYRTDGDLVNIRCIQASIHPSWTTVNDLLFKEDCELNTIDRNPQHSRHIETAVTAEEEEEEEEKEEEEEEEEEEGGLNCLVNWRPIRLHSASAGTIRVRRSVTVDFVQASADQ